MKLYLIHGWGGNSKGGWFDILKERLKNIEVISFDMPNTNHPKIEEWISEMNQKIKPDKETLLLGHSIGCLAIIKYLEQLPFNVKIKKVIFIAGWFNLKEDSYEDDEERQIAKPWIENPINFDEVKKHTKDFLAIFSDNDPFVPLSDTNLFKEKLNAKIIVQKSKGHFDSIQDFEDAYKEVEAFIR